MMDPERKEKPVGFSKYGEGDGRVLDGESKTAAAKPEMTEEDRAALEEENRRVDGDAH